MKFDKFKWRDHPSNPLIEPRRPEWMIADPSVLTPDETPDGKWHMFANSILGVHYFTSSDGVDWKYRRKVGSMGMRAYVRKHEGMYYLFYEKFNPPPFYSSIIVRKSSDLQNWSDEKTALAPSLPWHGSMFRNCGNPCAIEWKGEFLLYYSATVVLLKDCLFFEPRYIGVARAPRIEGPYIPDPEPIFSPDASDPFRNHGAGAIKVVPDEKRRLLWGFNNGIYIDGEGRSRSAIMIVKSKDGSNWEPVGDGKPILYPEPGWKRALVYALDVRMYNDKAYLFYNARDGWFIGSERIGLCICEE